jgi:hypothetical protein
MTLAALLLAVLAMEALAESPGVVAVWVFSLVCPGLLEPTTVDPAFNGPVVAGCDSLDKPAVIASTVFDEAAGVGLDKEGLGDAVLAELVTLTLDVVRSPANNGSSVSQPTADACLQHLHIQLV